MLLCLCQMLLMSGICTLLLRITEYSAIAYVKPPSMPLACSSKIAILYSNSAIIASKSSTNNYIYTQVMLIIWADQQEKISNSFIYIKSSARLKLKIMSLTREFHVVDVMLTFCIFGTRMLNIIVYVKRCCSKSTSLYYNISLIGFR